MATSKANIVITAQDRTKTAFASVDKGLAGLTSRAKAFIGIAAAAAAGAGFTALINKGREFTAAIADLSAITGATGADLKFLSEASKEFGKSTTLSATQAAEAFKLVASAKPDLLNNVEALKAVTKEAITLAEATGSDLPEAAKTLGSALNQFSEDADQAGRFINVLAAGAKLGASEVADTAQALKDAGVVAAQAGLSFEETNAALQAIAIDGIKAQKAGVGLRNVLLNLQTQSNSKINPAIVGMSKALDNLAGMNLSAADKVKLFGKESLAVANTLIKNRENFTQLTKSLTDTNVAYEQASIKANSFDGKMKALSSAVEGFAIQIFQQLQPGLTVLVEALTGFIRAVGDGIPKAFSFARTVAFSFIGAVSSGWEYIKFGALAAWEAIASSWSIAVDGMKRIFSKFIGGVASVLDKLPGLGDVSKSLQNYSNELASGADTFEKMKNRIKGLADERDREIAKINENVVSLIAFEISSKKAEKAATKHTETIKKKTKALTQSVAIQQVSNEESEHSKDLDRAAERLLESLLTKRQRLSKITSEYNELLLTGRITQEQYNLAVDMATDKIFGLGSASRDAAEEAKKAAEQMREHYNAFADDVQNIFEQVLFAGFEDGLSGMVDAFSNALQQMAIKAAASEIRNLLFGIPGSSPGAGLVGGSVPSDVGAAGGSLFGDVFNFGKNLFGGFFADGGFLQPGKIGIVGEQGAELIQAGSSGATITSNKDLGGTSIVINMNAPSPNARETADQIAVAVSGALSRANRRNG